jgi:hypothetical protein
LDEGSAGGPTAAAKCRGWVDAFTSEGGNSAAHAGASVRERTQDDQEKNAAP